MYAQKSEFVLLSPTRLLEQTVLPFPHRSMLFISYHNPVIALVQH